MTVLLLIFIVGIVIFIMGYVLVIAIKIRKIYYKKKKGLISGKEDHILKEILQPKEPNMSQLRLITKDELLIDYTKKLGGGEFGDVYPAKYIINKTKKFPVAVKVINVKQDIKPSIEKDMLEEASIMAQLGHDYLLKLVGISIAENIKIVTPLRPLGSLRDFLRKNDKVLGPKELLLYSYQISSAMNYLSSHNIIHRDLATRNALMKSRLHVEVCDFGLSAIFNEEIVALEKIPFRWAAIECLKDYKDPKIYSEASDVWSFGVTCWEIITYGEIPYDDMKFGGNALEKLYEYLNDGNRLKRPDNCGLEFYKTLIMCWSSNPPARPRFADLTKIFEKFSQNPFFYIKQNNQMSSKDHQPTPEVDQVLLINELLGDDDYLYSESQLNEETLRKSSQSSSLESSNSNNYHEKIYKFSSFYLELIKDEYLRGCIQSKNLKRSYSSPNLQISNPIFHKNFNNIKRENLYTKNPYIDLIDSYRK